MSIQRNFIAYQKTHKIHYQTNFGKTHTKHTDSIEDVASRLHYLATHSTILFHNFHSNDKLNTNI